MKVALCGLVIVALSTLIGLAGWAQSNLYIYPQQGQSEEQQSKDRFECHNWAVQQSGFDPGNPPQMAAPQQTTQPRVGRSAARGAAGGAVVGAIAGDAGKGAAIGATAGAVRGSRRQRAAQQQQAQAQAQYQQGLEGYNRALSACLGGRGYIVQ